MNRLGKRSHAGAAVRHEEGGDPVASTRGNVAMRGSLDESDVPDYGAERRFSPRLRSSAPGRVALVADAGRSRRSAHGEAGCRKEVKANPLLKRSWNS